MKGWWPSKVGNLGVDTFNLFHLLPLLRCVCFGKILQSKRFSNTITPKLFKVKIGP